MVLLSVVIVGVIAFVAFPSKESEQSYLGGLMETKQTADEEIAKASCISLCKSEMLNYTPEEFEKGPCLSGQIINDWVCDVAHKPRKTTDDDPRNQCSEFKTDMAHHYIEVDTNCQFIKAF